MTQATNTAITFVWFFTASKVGKTGLTVTVAVNGPSGNIVTKASNTAATELDLTNLPGMYTYTLSSGSTSANGNYYGEAFTGDSTVDYQNLPCLIICGDWVAKVNGLGVGNVTFTSPTANTATLGPIVRGNDYKAADGRSLDFTCVGFPSFTGGSVKFTVTNPNGTVLLSAIAGSVLSATQIRVELTAAQTLLLTPSTNWLLYSITVTLSNGDIVTPAIGTISVTQQVTP